VGAGSRARISEPPDPHHRALPRGRRGRRTAAHRRREARGALGAARHRGKSGRVNAAKVPANTVQEFVALVRANPDKFNYASQGTTTVSFLTTEMFKTTAGDLKITHVPYKGTAPGLAALLAGEVEMMFDNLGVTVQHVRSGKLKALAVGSGRRVPSLPEVPAMAEFYPGFVSIAWFSISAPPKTPAAIAEKLSAAIAEILKQPEVAKRLEALSAEPIGSTPAGMAAIMREDTERWRGVIRAAGLKPE
jgi:tripartite-type tricarboxylate transporter receptor subunit TctC